MRYLLILITVLSLTILSIQAQKKSTAISNWKTINGCGVSFQVPNDVEFVKDDSVDTCEREYRGKNIIVYVTVTEWNLSATEYSNWLNYCVTKTKISEKSGEIITSHKPRISENDNFENDGFDYVAMLHLPQITNNNLRINIFSKTTEDRNKAIKIFQSVQINNK